MEGKSLLHQAYLEMSEMCNREHKCTISFCDLAVLLGVEKNNAIDLVNALVNLGKVTFLGATEHLGNGDYLCMYGIETWQNNAN